MLTISVRGEFMDCIQPPRSIIQYELISVEKLQYILPTWRGCLASTLQFALFVRKMHAEHTLLTCSYIRVGAENPSASSSTWRYNYVCGLNFVDFRSEDLYHMTFHTASILDHLWASRRKYVHGRQYAPKWNHRSCSWEKEDWPSLQIKSISCLRQHLPL